MNIASKMDFTTVCRTCLSSDSLNPIFLNIDDYKRYSTAVYITTGIKVDPNDGLPQNMCTKCVNQLNDSLKFRKQCKTIETRLLQLKNKLKLPKLTDYEQTEKDSYNLILDIEPETELDVRTDEKEIKNEHMDDCEHDDDDDDDKPLKYLLENETDDNKADILIFVDNSDQIQDIINVKKFHSDQTTEKPFYTLESSDPKRKRVACKLCQKNLSIRSIDTHMARSHPGADERKDKCELCDTYVLREKMNRHRKMMHGSEQALRCGYCKEEFDCKEVLVEHVTMCTAKKKRRKVSEASKELRECDICHKKMQKASLRMHKAVKHAGLGPVCEHCGRRFGNKFRLNEHYRAKHGYDKFKCSYCDFQSAGVMAMRNHERRHRGEKPFVCETCGAKFHAAYLLAQHRQSHRTDKLVKCDLCPASFKANNSLHMHKITCHSTCLYKCLLCSQAYSCRHYTVKHLRHVHDYRGPVPKLQTVEKDFHSA